MSETERAWAAGFWDGEGCCSLVRDRKGNLRFPRLGISQMRGPELLERFQAATGGYGSIDYRERNHKGPRGHYHQYTWRLRRKAEIVEVMSALWPYLGEVKKAQYQECLRINESFTDGRRK